MQNARREKTLSVCTFGIFAGEGKQFRELPIGNWTVFLEKRTVTTFRH